MRRSLLSLLLLANVHSVMGQSAPADSAVPGVPGVAGAAVPEAEFHPSWVVLAVSINDVLLGGEIEAVQIGADLAVSLHTLQVWNMVVPADVRPHVIEGGQFVFLNDLPGLQWHIDGGTQTLVLQAQPVAFRAGSVSLGRGASATVTPSPWGGYLNYDVQADRFAEEETVSGLYELNVFSRHGTGSSSSLYRSRPPVFGGSRHVRLDTTWTIDLPDRHQTVWLGDAIGRGGTLGRSVRFGGVRWGTNFGLTPGFSTLALPTIRGEAALPSTLDLYINNHYGSRAEVPAGPFDLAELPVVTGQGEIRMVVRDLLGREQVVTQQYYASPLLLRPGLRDFSLEAGRIREDYGFHSNRYGRAFFAGTERKGITPGFTREVRAEWLSSQQTAALGGSWLLGSAGTFSLQGAGSRSRAGSGWSSGASFDRQARGFSGNASVRYASREFAQLGEFEGRTTRVTTTLAVGVPFMQGGLGASYARQSTWQREDNRITTLSYSRSLGRNSFLSLSAVRQSGDSRSSTIALTFVHALGVRDSASVVHNRSRDHERDERNSYTALQLQRNVPSGPGFGYQIQAEEGAARRYSALGNWNSRYARLTAGAAGGEGMDTAYRVGAAGSVAFIEGALYPARQIDDSFAVVKVDDFEGIGILHDNQPVATTGRRGLAFIPGLRGYQRNEITLEQADLPFDAEIERLSVYVTPAMRSGVAVAFPVRRTYTATGHLMRADGTPLPPGTRLTASYQSAPVIVGYDGRVFVSSTERSVTLSGRGVPCEVSIELGAVGESVADLGKIECREL